MAFERYVIHRQHPRPLASLWVRGQIGINQGAVERFTINDYTFAVLFYDRDTERIGM